VSGGCGTPAEETSRELDSGPITQCALTPSELLSSTHLTPWWKTNSADSGRPLATKRFTDGLMIIAAETGYSSVGTLVKLLYLDAAFAETNKGI
jgi:hypothetical protein